MVHGKGFGNLISLRIFFLTLHLLLMNFAAAGPLLAVWLDMRGTGRNSPETQRLGQSVGWWSLAALGLGIILGSMQLLLFWSVGFTDYFDTIFRLWDSKIVYGMWEIGFSAVCVIGYLVWWQRSNRPRRWQRLVSRGLTVLAATNLLYHFPTLFTIIGLLARSGEPSAEPITGADFRTLLIQPEVIAMTLHFWLASFAVSGLVVSLMSVGETIPDRVIVTRGAQVCLVATLLQLPIGFYFTTVLPVTEQSRLLGGDMLATLTFLAAILAAMWLLHLLASLAVFQVDRPKLYQAAIAMVATVGLMTASMILSRSGFPPPTT